MGDNPTDDGMSTQVSRGRQVEAMKASQGRASQARTQVEALGSVVVQTLGCQHCTERL